MASVSKAIRLIKYIILLIALPLCNDDRIRYVVELLS